MKIARYRHAGSERYGTVSGDRVTPLPLSAGASFDEVLLLLAGPEEPAEGESVALTDVELLTPVREPRKIVCVGANYRKHVLETGNTIPVLPTLFTRYADTLVAHDRSLVDPAESDELDYEGELAIVIGRTASHVRADDAVSVIAGYSCFNDGSIRDFQHHTTQWTPGKNFEATGGFGPWIVTPDEVGELDSLVLRTRVNGEERQNTELGDMIFGVPRLIEYITGFTTLRAGDVVITGTPSGVGGFSKPTRFLKPGDVVEVEIDGIGVLRNDVVSA